jgi:glutamine amidotransferase
MIRKAGGFVELCSQSSELDSAKAIILPGVGSFDNVITKINNSKILDELKYKVIDDKIPFLGVCAGMQVLFEKSQEGELSGLGWVRGEVTRFNFLDKQSLRDLKIPHIGWNTVSIKKHNDLFFNLENDSRFYFVHSYHANCKNSSDILSTSNYGYNFVSAIKHGNIWGVQFHPEKSHRFGLQFFKNFLRVIDNA